MVAYKKQIKTKGFITSNAHKDASRRGRNVTGFTLVELLLIIAIIGLLMSIILVNLNTAKIKAQKVSAWAEVRSAAAAVQSCLIENRNVYCYSGVTPAPCNGSSAPVSSQYMCEGSTEEVWPDIERYRHHYAPLAHADTASDLFAYAIYRDLDDDGDPDNAKGFCCTINGCQEVNTVSTPDILGQRCKSLGKIF